MYELGVPNLGNSERARCAVRRAITRRGGCGGGDGARQVALAARGQTISVAFYPRTGLVLYGSEQAAVKAALGLKYPQHRPEQQGVPRESSKLRGASTTSDADKFVDRTLERQTRGGAPPSADGEDAGNVEDASSVAALQGRAKQRSRGYSGASGESGTADDTAAKAAREERRSTALFFEPTADSLTASRRRLTTSGKKELLEWEVRQRPAVVAAV